MPAALTALNAVCPKCRNDSWDRCSTTDHMICTKCGWAYDPASSMSVDDDPEVQDMLALSSGWREHVDEAYKDLITVMTDGEAMIAINGALKGLENEESPTNCREFHKRTQALFEEFKKRPALMCEGCKKRRRVTEVRQTPKKPGGFIRRWDGRWHLLCPDCQDAEDVIIGIDVGTDGGGAMIVAAYDPVEDKMTVKAHAAVPPATPMVKAVEKFAKVAEAFGASMADVARAMSALGSMGRDHRQLEWALRMKAANPELYERAVSEARSTGDTLQVAYERLAMFDMMAARR